MIFNINISVVSSVKKYSKKSCEIIFLKENNDFTKFISDQKLTISDLQKNKFTKDENAEIQYWKENSPESLIFKKCEINKKFNSDYFRNYLAGFIQKIEKGNFENLYIHVPDYFEYKSKFNEEEYYFQTFIEGILLGNYNFNKYKKEKKSPQKLDVIFITSKLNQFKKVILKAEQIISGVYFTRDLVNEPANVLTPNEFAQRVKTEFRNTEVSVKVFDKKELKKRKMNAILSVGKASENKPRLIIAHYKPKVKITKKIALVGKGVTYDTGGLSLKTTKDMIDMKVDMAGGGTVFGIIKAAEKLRLPIEIIGIVPAVENSVSGNAYKPGDIISTSSGKTIEVKDTDAEGRIVLADALEYASQQKPDEIIDFATLTGAIVVALGLFTAGIFSKNDKMCERLINSAKQTYEHVWRMPFWDEFNKLMDSKIADVSNLGIRWGGAISAGKFLEHFVDENIPWTHIDLAGPALEHDLTNYTKDYATGYGVRLICNYLENL